MRDLSHPIRTGMTVYPGDPGVQVTPALTIGADGVDVALVTCGSHTGTHLDAPSHTVPGGRTTGRITLDELVGDALVAHLGSVPAGAVYGLDEIGAAMGGLPERVPPIVVVDTGWAARFATAEATAHPAMDPAAARELVARGMHVLAVDTLSPDRTGGDGFPVHDAVLGSDHLIVENLTNLDGLPTRTRVAFLPLAIDADGAPIRAVAL